MNIPSITPTFFPPGTELRVCDKTTDPEKHKIRQVLLENGRDMSSSLPFSQAGLNGEIETFRVIKIDCDARLVYVMVVNE